MQITELESKGLKRSLKIVVEAGRINSQTEAELKEAGTRVKIPGFRPGNIPMKVLKQRYGKAVQADVLKNVIGQSSQEALTEKKLRPAMTPQIAIDDYKDDGDLTYTMHFEIFPDMPEIDFATLALERQMFDIGEKDIDEALARIAERSPAFARAKEGSAAKKGQVVTIDFKGSIDGTLFDGGSAERFRLELGSGQFIPGFEDQLVGAKEGDGRTVAVTFPADYQSEQLKGKEASFAVHVHEIHDKSAPAIDEAFAKERGFADLSALRDAVKKQMAMEYDQLVRRDLKKKLFDALEEKCDFPLPQGMVDMEFNVIWQRLEEARKQGDPSLEGKSDDELKKEYRTIAERRVKLGLLLADIGYRQKIAVTNEELSRAVMQQASQFPGQEKKVVDFYRNNPERAEDLRGPILEEKAVDFILSKVKYDDKKVTLEALMASASDDAAPAESKEKKKSAAKPKAKKKSAEE